MSDSFNSRVLIFALLLPFFFVLKLFIIIFTIQIKVYFWQHFTTFDFFLYLLFFCIFLILLNYIFVVILNYKSLLIYHWLSFQFLCLCSTLNECTNKTTHYFKTFWNILVATLLQTHYLFKVKIKFKIKTSIPTTHKKGHILFNIKIVHMQYNVILILTIIQYTK